ncbi:VOC family protein [Pectobacterium peruviense]|uniref:VOC family protein n=1 Tax=Pectobacterium peruviense TaxID=2066479 RepID=UPI000DE25835|nr:VOC family protein [Pectobacterium peruviense]
MKVAHVALWTADLVAQAAFWQEFFAAQVGEKYVSRNRPGFESHFVQLSEGASIELMTLPVLAEAFTNKEGCGWAHVAISVGSKADVEALASKAAERGILVASPRMTGDGFYEAIVSDPDGNLIEITSD